MLFLFAFVLLSFAEKLDSGSKDTLLTLSFFEGFAEVIAMFMVLAHYLK